MDTLEFKESPNVFRTLSFWVNLRFIPSFVWESSLDLSFNADESIEPLIVVDDKVSYLFLLSRFLLPLKCLLLAIMILWMFGTNNSYLTAMFLIAVYQLSTP